jgi:hypothetical protein
MNAIRKLPPWALTLISVAPGLAILPFAKILPDPGVEIWAGLAIVWALVFACLSWRRLDETGRTAHSSAWFWGGSTALFLAMVAVMLTILIPGFERPLVAFVDGWSKKHPAGQMGFIFGVLAAAMAQVIGYFIAWMIWWGKRR